MFKTEILRLFFTFLILIILGELNMEGQVPEHQLPDLRGNAIEKFKEKEFSSAETDFRKLMRLFPDDPMYRYYAGICKLEMNEDLEHAVELLYFASTRGVPEDVSYYLGEAYRKLYDFEKAKRELLTSSTSVAFSEYVFSPTSSNLSFPESILSLINS